MQVVAVLFTLLLFVFKSNTIRRDHYKPWSSRQAAPAQLRMLPPEDVTYSNCFQNICQQVSNYPQDAIKKAIDNIPELGSTFGKIFNPNLDENVVVNRNGGSEENFCVSETKYLRPRQLKNTRNKETYIVNTDEYQQIVAVESCVGAQQSCQVLDSKWVQSHCVQRYHKVKLLTYANYRNGQEEVKYDIFEFPSACQCKVMDAAFF